jgi:hypothetical protein
MEWMMQEAAAIAHPPLCAHYILLILFSIFYFAWA